jgi:hypothetical protein
MREDEIKLNERWIEEQPLEVLDGLKEQYDVEGAVEGLANAGDAYGQGYAQGQADAQRANQMQADQMACAQVMAGRDIGIKWLGLQSESLCFATQAFEHLISEKRVAVSVGTATASVADLAELKLSLLRR